MNHLDKLGSFLEFDFIFYEHPDPKLILEYNRMQALVKEDGHALTDSPWPLNAGILLEKDNVVIAGIFFNLIKYENSILLNLTYVDILHRRMGIYKQLNRFIDLIGVEKNKSNLYSYIHIENSTMVNYVMPSIGYTPVMTLVRRKINDNINP